MCGIAVCIDASGSVDRDRFDRMVDIVKHRGPDDRGTFYEGGLALGHRRLAIIDTSSEGHQPFEKVDGFVLVFNGEIYNYVELGNELAEKGHHFYTKTDTEVIIHSYIEWGRDCVEHFNGMWSFVLYDRINSVLFCSRDRFGVKPFYYTEQEGMFLIASEIKQFFQMLANNPKADKDMLVQYIVRGIIENPPRTLFSDIFQLEPGHNLIYDLHSHSYRKERYYDIGAFREKSMTYKEACEIFRKQFDDAVMLRHRSDVPLGYYLSGGIDSSAIVCDAKALAVKTKEKHTISACYDDKKYDEQEYIDEVIRKTDVISHKIFPDGQTMLDDLDMMIWHMDEPVQGPSGFAQWSVCKAAKECGLTVMLDGQGSDEQLAGYTDFYTVLFLYYLRKGKIREFQKEVEAFLQLKAGSVRNSNVARFWVILTAIKDYLTPEKLERFIKRLYLEIKVKLPFEKGLLKRLIENERIYPKRDPRCFIKEYMENELLYQLHQGDRYSMAFSIENRNPFLDYRLVNSIYEMPFEFKIKSGYTKAVLRDSMEGILPEIVRKRVSKFGFETPKARWFDENEKYYRNEFVKSLNTFETLFDIKKIMAWYDNCKDRQTRDGLMWRVIDSSRWIGIFNVTID